MSGTRSRTSACRCMRASEARRWKGKSERQRSRALTLQSVANHKLGKSVLGEKSDRRPTADACRPSGLSLAIPADVRMARAATLTTPILETYVRVRTGILSAALPGRCSRP